MITKMKNMKISRRLMLSYVVVLALLVISMVVSVANLINIGNKITQFYEHPFKVSASANIINARFEDMQKSVFRAISNMDLGITQEAIQDAKDASTVISENMTVIEELYLGDKSDVENIKAELAKLAPMRETVLNYASNNQNEQAAAYMEKNNIPLIKEIQVDLNALIDTADTTGANLIQSLQTTQTLAIIVLLALGVASVAISLMFAKFITNSITKPISQIEVLAENLVVGKMDVSVVTEVWEDEVGHLARNFSTTIENVKLLIEDIAYLMGEIAHGNLDTRTKNEAVYVGEFLPILTAMREMTTNVSETIAQINDASIQVSEGSTQMADSAQGLAEGATEQAGAVEELTATVENVADAAQRTAEDTQKAYLEVNESVHKAEDSQHQMEKLMEAMERINSTSKEIENIIAAIEDIASQTNLLSLNASIEAARAGEAGKGFAVVADQIGKLASDSAQSASNTRELIMKTLQEIEVGNNIANVAAKAFEEIIGEIENFSNIAQVTSQKSTEQYGSLHQIQDGIEQISSVVQSNSAAAEETSATSEELAAQAENLQTLVARFRLKQI